jgi:uncharacterized protein (DUF1330 family)
MPAFWVAQVNVTDPESYGKYSAVVPAILEKYGGRFIARGGRHETLEGDAAKTRVVVIAFESFESALECYRSPEYQAARKFRDGAGDIQLSIVESADP